MKRSFTAFFLLLPPVLSFLVLGAHFMRDGRLIMTFLCLVFLVGLFFRRTLSARLARIALLLGTLEWILTTYGFVLERQEMGIPWTRMAIILGAVTLLTLLSSLVFSTRAMKERYGSKREASSSVDEAVEG